VPNRKTVSLPILHFVVSTVIALLLTTINIVAVAGPAVAAFRSIYYPDFSSTAGLTLNGSAAQADGKVLRLTPNKEDQKGSAWLQTPIDLAQSFSTSFQVSLHNGSGDGVAFVIQAVGLDALGDLGGGIGYGSIDNDTLQSLIPSVAVEFDTWQNEWDPNDNHISVVRDGAVDLQDHVLANGNPGFNLVGTPFTVWIYYDARNHFLDVYAAREGGSPRLTPIVSTPLNLVERLGARRSFAGFTGGTGIAIADQDILSWRLSPTSPRSLPTMDGGTFVNVGAPPGAPHNVCTTAFSVMKGSTRYMLSAGHCLKPEGFVPNSVHIYTTDMREPFYFASMLHCVEHESNAACLTAPLGSKPTGDMFAFRPDVSVPTSMVQTRSGLLPVLGKSGWFKGQTDVCKWGKATRETCGEVVGPDSSHDDLVALSAKGNCGDSGGPVYTYVRDAKHHHKIGVKVIGMTLASVYKVKWGKDCYAPGKPSYFVSIDDIERILGVSLVSSSPIP
jgi:hypothetical protein